MDPEQITQNIEFANTGLNIRLDPKRIPAGAFQYVNNIISEQEGAITVRRGMKVVGSTPHLGHTYAKMLVSTGELPAYIGNAGGGYIPSTNYRYIGDLGGIYRSQDMKTQTNIASDGYNNAASVCTSPQTAQLSPLWSAATYNAGTTGIPTEYFACQYFMLKDGNNNLATANHAQKWGILPAYGVPINQTVTVISADQNTPVNVYVSTVHRQVNGDEVGIAGVVGNSSVNGQFFVAVTSNTVFQIYADSALTASPIAASGAYQSGGLVANLMGLFPNGGGPGAPAGSLPYQYAYTYSNSKTLAEGNLSQEQIADTAVPYGGPISVYNNYVLINSIWGTDDPQVDLIYLYRKGGTWTDGLYRKIQVFGNPGLAGTVGSYLDVAPDSLIANQDLLTFPGFHDPPVPSTAPVPFKATTSNTYGPGRVTNFTVWPANVKMFQNSTAPLSTAVPNGGSRGSVMTFIGGEQVVVEAITSTNVATVYLQQSHAAGASVEIDTVCNQSCNLVCQAFDALFVAGDPSNPHILYKSSTGMPEYFPVVDQAGNAQQVVVGNPGDPIVNIIEFRGAILCMNANHLYEVNVFNGVMLTPNVTPALRGLVSKDAWCRVDNEIWYLGYDGIWSWDGAQSIKRSEAIDPIFHNLVIASGTPAVVYPIDYTPAVLQFSKMCYHRHKVQFLYTDTNGAVYELEYDIVADRWLRHNKNLAGGLGNESLGFVETDTGNKVLLRNEIVASVGAIYIDDADDESNNTADGYNDATGPTAGGGGGGSTIAGVAITGWLDAGNPYIEKVIDEFMLDVDMNGASGNSLVVKVYADYSFTAIDTFSIGSNTNGRQWVSLISNSQSDANLSNSKSGYSRQIRTVAFEFDFTGGPKRPSLYGMRITFRPVGAITAGPVYDWNDLGYLWDKRLTEFTVTFDTATTSQTLIMDTINGIDGKTVNLDVGTFVINNSVVNSGPGRGMKVFAVPDSTIAKLVRLRALSANNSAINSSFFRLLNVDFQYTKFPPDVTLFTEPNDFGYPCEKIARNLTMKVDTGGVAATVYLLADATPVASYSVTTGLDDWSRILPVPNVPTAGDAIGRLFKLQITPGTGGKAQLFDWSLDFVKEPCSVQQIDTYETDFGFVGWKYIYQGWFDYFASNPLTLNIIRDGGTVFYSTTLPAHASARDLERIFLPMAVGSVFNKSKIYRIRINGSGHPFKLYSNTKLEWMPWNGDQRAGFQQYPLSPENQLPAGPTGGQ